MGGGDQERGMGRSSGDSLVSSLGHWVHGDAPGKHPGRETSSKGEVGGLRQELRALVGNLVLLQDR